MANTDADETRRLKSVDKAFDIIDVLRREGPATLSEVAEQFDMPTSTAHLHLTTLVKNGYVLRENNEYWCSLQFHRTAGEIRDQLPLFQAARSEADALQEELGEISNIAMMENGYMVKIYKSVNPESIDDRSPAGTHLYMHRTARGKAILASLDESVVDQSIETRGMPSKTEKSLSTREELDAELAEIREQEYAVNRGEHYGGVCAVGVPIMTESTGVVGAISVSGPQSRMGSDRIEESIVPGLKDAKNIIELKLK
jgi:IclR family acetate operon transcriptional repressor